MERLLSHVGPVDIGNFKLAAGTRPQPGGDIDDCLVVEIEPRHGVSRFRLCRLLFERNRPPLGVELNHAESFRVAHIIGEDRRAAGAGGSPLQHLPETVAVEDVVAEHQRRPRPIEEFPPDDKCLCQAVGLGLRGIADRHAKG